MTIWTSLEDKGIPQGGVITLGFFDGVHRGHQALIHAVRTWAHELGVPAFVITLWPHPRAVLEDTNVLHQWLNEPRYKLRFIQQYGIDGTLVLEFTKELAQATPQQFLDKVCEVFAPKGFIMGYDHHFGAKGKGDFAFLQAYAAQHGFAARCQEAIYWKGEEISSTQIREAISEGKIAYANDLMGRPFGYIGSVVHGEGKGHQLGFPTANIETPNAWQLLPKGGVYHGRIRIEESHKGYTPGEEWYAVINVGTRPTIHAQGQLCVEAHLLDFTGDLYGERVEVTFEERVRDEQHFQNIEALRDAIASDVKALRCKLTGDAC